MFRLIVWRQYVRRVNNCVCRFSRQLQLAEVRPSGDVCLPHQPVYHLYRVCQSTSSRSYTMMPHLHVMRMTPSWHLRDIPVTIHPTFGLPRQPVDTVVVTTCRRDGQSRGCYEGDTGVWLGQQSRGCGERLGTIPASAGHPGARSAGGRLCRSASVWRAQWRQWQRRRRRLSAGKQSAVPTADAWNRLARAFTL